MIPRDTETLLDEAAAYCVAAVDAQERHTQTVLLVNAALKLGAARAMLPLDNDALAGRVQAQTIKLWLLAAGLNNEPGGT